MPLCKSAKMLAQQSPTCDRSDAYMFVHACNHSGHGDVVLGISWSADGQQLATACEDLYVRVFDVSDITNREPKFRRIKTARTPVGAGFADARGDNISVVMRGEMCALQRCVCVCVCVRAGF